MTRRTLALASAALLATTAAVLATTDADAHISLAGPGFANTSQELVFGVGHGCSGSDTYKVKIQIPAGVTSVRPATSGFGKTSVEKDGAGLVTSVTWTKADADILPADVEFYKLSMRVKVPNAPFTTVYFPTTQYCRSSTGIESLNEWVGTPANTPAADAGAPDAAAPQPAPFLVVMPPRAAGWNKVTVGDAVKDLTIFNDAQIVWAGTAAYSSNPLTQALIKTEPGVTTLTAINAGAEVWVKY